MLNVMSNVRLFLFKTFPGHRGRPGLVGGSAPKMAPMPGDDAGVGELAVVRAKADATLSREEAKRQVLADHQNGKKPVIMDGIGYYISAKALNKMTAEHGEGGADKPFQRERIVAIQALDELASRASVMYRDDRKSDPDVDLIAEGRAWFAYAGKLYQIRLLGKIWRQGAHRLDKLHSMAIEDVMIEEPGTDQLSLDAGDNLHKNLGIDRLGMSGNRLSASVAFANRILALRKESRPAWAQRR